MYLKSIIYQREELGPLLKGWYIGKKDNCYLTEECCFLDENYQPIPKDIEIDGRMVSVLRVHKDLKNPVCIQLPESRKED